MRQDLFKKMLKDIKYQRVVSEPDGEKILICNDILEVLKKDKDLNILSSNLKRVKK